MTRRCLRSWAIDILSGLSLLIFLLAMGIWVRSYFAAECIGRRQNRIGLPEDNFLAVCCAYEVHWSYGEVYLGRSCFRGRQEGIEDSDWYYEALVPFKPRQGGRVDFKVAGIQIYDDALIGFGGIQRESFVQLPFWLFVLFAIPPLLWVRRWRRSGVAAEGFPLM